MGENENVLKGAQQSCGFLYSQHPSLLRCLRVGFTAAAFLLPLHLAQDLQDMSAVLVSNYEMTVGAMMEMNDLGIRIPEEVSVIGFDNLDFARACSPRLSIVTQPTKEIAGNAAALLLKRLEENDSLGAGGPEGGRETVILKTGFAEGDSVKVLDRKREEKDHGNLSAGN